MRIEFKPRAVKDLDALDRPTARRVLEKIRGRKTIWRAT
jgi:mRNA-degrading endonuclease RelE of RelBE toxin-antitoxin system